MMSNENGPNPARPDTDASAAQAQGHDPAGAQPPMGHDAGTGQGAQGPEGTGAGSDPFLDAALESAAAEAANAAPETKEKNKIFESVRLKARLMMADQELDKLRAEVEKLRNAPAEYQDKNMRLMADMENLRRRSERERADTAKFAITRFARDVLTVADNFQRAIDAVPKDAVAADGPLKNLFEGVELTGRELLTTMERHGVKRIDPTGMRFDPNVHQAMMQVENAEVPNGTVIQSFQPAYMIEDRVLRPAMVVVSTGGPKVPKPTEGAQQDDMAAEGTAHDGPSVGPGDGTSSDPTQQG